MTQNQLAYQANLEAQRANQAREAENLRSNQAREAETHRSNVVAENQKAVDLAIKGVGTVGNTISNFIPLVGGIKSAANAAKNFLKFKF